MAEGTLSRPAVSVVIPTFNDAPEHLSQSIESARSQTLRPHEVIVVDDGSSREDLLDFLDRVGQDITVLRQANSGPSAARNAGIARASGEFIVTVDGDD